MQCRICLEGPRSDDPLRRRCNCADAFHDGCLVSWIRSKGDARACCEICGEPFRGVAREEQSVELRPGIYIAYVVGAGNWLIATGCLHSLFPLPNTPSNCGEKRMDAYTHSVCQQLDLIAWWVMRMVYWWAAFLWARRSYSVQLQRLPATWGASVRYSILTLKPNGGAARAVRWAQLRTAYYSMTAVAAHIARAAQLEMTMRDAAAQRHENLRRLGRRPPYGPGFLS